jgi:hypothetical protein
LRRGFGATTLVAAVLAASGLAHAQAPARAADAVPRTPWGSPDLQGTWDYRTITPLERPREVNGREFYTEEEAAKLEGRAGRRMDGPPESIQPGLNHAQYLTDPGRMLADGKRTSLIVEPADGRIPALTAEGKARLSRQPNRAASGAAVSSWLDRGNQERCITYGLPTASLPTLYNNNIMIVQTPDTAVIVHEMIHEARVIPLDGRPALSSRIGQWIGSSRGHWEGDTLVVETTNFNGTIGVTGNGRLMPTSDALKMVERFTRTSADTIQYEATVDDPKTWTGPWRVSFPLKRDGDYGFFEYACHEGNYAMTNLLEVARDEEKANAAKPAGGESK